jgi:hypothetical protein
MTAANAMISNATNNMISSPWVHILFFYDITTLGEQFIDARQRVPIGYKVKKDHRLDLARQRKPSHPRRMQILHVGPLVHTQGHLVEGAGKKG